MGILCLCVVGKKWDLWTCWSFGDSTYFCVQDYEELGSDEDESEEGMKLMAQMVLLAERKKLLLKNTMTTNT